MRDIYYYLHGVSGSRITVCLLIDDNLIVQARGISICSPNDQFVRNTGRAKAKGRAMQAWYHHADWDPVQPTKLHLDEAYITFKYKATFVPVLTPRELKIVEKLRAYEGNSVDSGMVVGID